MGKYNKTEPESPFLLPANVIKSSFMAKLIRWLNNLKMKEQV